MWVNKEMQIGVLTLAEVQVDLYKKYLEAFQNQELALRHTEISMKAMMLSSKSEDDNND